MQFPLWTLYLKEISNFQRTLTIIYDLGWRCFVFQFLLRLTSVSLKRKNFFRLRNTTALNWTGAFLQLTSKFCIFPGFKKIFNDILIITSQSIIKNLVGPSHKFLLPYITVEQYFIIFFTFIFNLYFLCFVDDELPAFINNVNNF